MLKKSAGILLFRSTGCSPEVLLAHPGGPYWVHKDNGVWSIPKGEFDNEAPLEAAKREFEEETGKYVEGEFIELLPIRQKSGKTIYAWAIQGEFDPAELKSNNFEMEWPPKSGSKKSFPEIDKAEWFSFKDAKEKIIYGQTGFIDQLEKMLSEKK